MVKKYAWDTFKKGLPEEDFSKIETNEKFYKIFEKIYETMTPDERYVYAYADESSAIMAYWILKHKRSEL